MNESHPQTPSIDAEIFSTGQWNGERFTRRDLHEIVRNFRHLRGQLKPPLKFGHDEGQTLLGQHDGDPALGWVQRLWVEGDRLLARFVGVPRVVYEAIHAGRYRRVSAELYFDVRLAGRKLGKALKAVALLGADLPAVTNLRDLGAYLASVGTLDGVPDDRAARARLRLAGARAYALPVHAGRIDSTHDLNPTPEERTMPELESAPQTQGEGQPEPDAELQPELQAELAELRAYKDRSEQRRGEERQRRQGEAFRGVRENAVAFCETQVNAGRITPHQFERLVKELDAQARTFAVGQPLRVSFDWVRRFLEGTPALLPPGEAAHAALDGAPGVDDENPSVRLARLAANAMAELNLSYGNAAAYVMRTDPMLARAYRDYTINPN